MMESSDRHFGWLNICSNIIEGYEHLIRVNDKYAPLVIEKGVPPLITLSALLPNSEVMTILERNVPRAREVSVKAEGTRITVYALDFKVISAIGTGEDRCEVDFLNLEPIGLKIRGDSRALYAGNSEFARGHFKNSGTVIRIGP